ncbi:MAG TPA: LLM class flavin-dependent oxidoreductase [Thermomicrobiaceae bacterium]|nr:LLM class flavin-dependent oxidoreductase [Thermomicrobiaceae bacterium]
MRFGFVLPRGDARAAAELAHEAEQAGWDGFFVSDLLWGIDAWVSLAAAAMLTERIRLGTLLSPLSRMRPWKLAGETVTLDHLSGGRVTLAVGLGAIDTGFAAFGEVTDRRTRAELLDEGLNILTGLWRGQPFRYSGRHYTVEPTDFPAPPPPVQQPRIPIWVAAAWPNPRSMRRALRYDGVLPMVIGDDAAARQATPDDVRAIAAYATDRRREPGPFDIVVEGETPGDDPAAAAQQVRAWAEAGATWWIETRWSAPDLEAVRARLAQRPPPLDRESVLPKH